VRWSSGALEPVCSKSSLERGETLVTGEVPVVLIYVEEHVDKFALTHGGQGAHIVVTHGVDDDHLFCRGWNFLLGGWDLCSVGGSWSFSGTDSSHREVSGWMCLLIVCIHSSLSTLSRSYSSSDSEGRMTTLCLVSHFSCAIDAVKSKSQALFRRSTTPSWLYPSSFK